MQYLTKPLLVLICVLCIPQFGNSKCAGSGFNVWPQTATICTKPTLMLEGFAKSQDIINELNKKYPIYLVNGKTKIKLIVKEICKGEFSITQAILTPEKPLTEGKTYTLYIGSLGKYDRAPEKWNSTTQTSEAAKWKVKKETISVAPTWINYPKFISQTIEYFGCGPAKHVNFAFKNNNSSTTLIRTCLTNTKTNTTTVYYVSETQDDTLRLGHGMCSGPFALNGSTYNVAFSLLDCNGNTSKNNPKPIAFTFKPDEIKE